MPRSRFGPIALRGNGPTASEIVIRDRDRFYESGHKNLAVRGAGQKRSQVAVGEEPAAASEPTAPSRFNPIKLRGGEPISITILRGRGHGSEHPDIAAWEASQKKSEEAGAEHERGSSRSSR